jgi:hypothetical protein
MVGLILNQTARAPKHREVRVVGRRLLAFAADWLVFDACGALGSGVVMYVSSGHPHAPDQAWEAQGIGLLTMTLPFTLYFAVLESSSLRASLSKHLLSLEVRGDLGSRL